MSVEDLGRVTVVEDPPASSAPTASARPSSPTQPSPDGAASRLQQSFMGRREELDGTSQQAALDSFLGPEQPTRALPPMPPSCPSRFHQPRGM
jgi:hypothetical protein